MPLRKALSLDEEFRPDATSAERAYVSQRLDGEQPVRGERESMPDHMGDLLTIIMDRADLAIRGLAGDGTARVGISDILQAARRCREIVVQSARTLPPDRMSVHGLLMERMGMGVVLLDGNRQIVWFDRTAERILSENQAFIANRGGLVAMDPAENTQLDRAVGRCLLLADGETGHADTLLAIICASHKLEIFVTPTRGAHVSEARVTLILNERDRKIDPTLLQRSYGLSRAESRIVAALASGMGADRISTVLSIQPNTIRAHLKSAYRKMGVSCQAELVSEVLSGLLRFAGLGSGRSDGVDSFVPREKRG